MRYVALIERTPTGYRAYAPDLDGCVAYAPTRDEAKAHLRRLMTMHLVSLAHAGETAPPPSVEAVNISIDVGISYGTLPVPEPIAKIMPASATLLQDVA